MHYTYGIPNYHAEEYMPSMNHRGPNISPSRLHAAQPTPHLTLCAATSADLRSIRSHHSHSRRR